MCKNLAENQKKKQKKVNLPTPIYFLTFRFSYLFPSQKKKQARFRIRLGLFLSLVAFRSPLNSLRARSTCTRVAIVLWSSLGCPGAEEKQTEDGADEMKNSGYSNFPAERIWSEFLRFFSAVFFQSNICIYCCIFWTWTKSQIREDVWFFLRAFLFFLSGVLKQILVGFLKGLVFQVFGLLQFFFLAFLNLRANLEFGDYFGIVWLSTGQAHIGLSLCHCMQGWNS